MLRTSWSLWPIRRVQNTRILLFTRYRSTQIRGKLYPRSFIQRDSLPQPPPTRRVPRFPSSPTTSPTNYLQANLISWANSSAVHDRLESFGILREDLQPLLQHFVDSVQNDQLPASSLRLDLLHPSHSSHEKKHTLDTLLSSTLIRWASQPSQSALLRSNGVSDTSLSQMSRLADATDMSDPSQWFPLARTMRRKIIMHVGPTNSGKTHNALRALAASNRGLYAGPLRLLAHEIWERLNLGQIVPLGVAQPPPTHAHNNARTSHDANNSNSTPRSPNSPVDIGDGKPPLQSSSTKAYIRPCNLITGEEQKIVSPHAPLVSCTVEMANFNTILDVAVIDEIQMISDPDRGNAWTNAVLGLPAHQLHLCGEETAVPIIQQIVQETGDELVVHRYQRLSPLKIEEESLNGDLGGVRKGDCVVTFSRKGIHRLKQQIEARTNLRCALAYGKLPPEIRSEQAALFNDPNSGYDVIIGSDALGMGLNLKIKRIVFETLTKWDGEHERPLSVSQVKQIAGRAGRYGLHHSSDPGGTVTTLSPLDLPALHHYLAQDAPSLPNARLLAPSHKFTQVVSSLPPNSSTHTIYEALIYLAKLGPPYAYTNYARLGTRTGMIDRTMKCTVEVKSQMMMAPIPWRDDISMESIERILKRYGDSRDITADTLLLSSSPNSKKKGGKSEHAEALETIESLMQAQSSSSSGVVTTPERRPYELLMLESLHNLLVFYMWMSFRNPVMFHDYERVQQLKERTEVALEYCLEGLTEVSEREQKEVVEKELEERGVSLPAGHRNRKRNGKMRKMKGESTWSDNGNDGRKGSEESSFEKHKQDMQKRSRKIDYRPGWQMRLEQK